MAKKADLLEKAKSLGLKLSEKNTIAEIEAAIKSTQDQAEPAEMIEQEREEVVLEKANVLTAKAGKRSAKALAEAEERAAKEARKMAGDVSPQSDDVEANVKKGPKPITRSRLERRGKKYQAVAKLVDKSKTYGLEEALAVAIKTNPAKFDASVEVHVRLGVDPRQADQNIRATVSLPNGTGKDIKVAVFAPEEDFAAAKKAGADIVGDQDFLKQLDKELLNFDVLIATPKQMPKLGKYARLLGPRGLMPNPKAGTVATDVAKAVTEAKAGKVEYRVDKQAIVHLSIGKVSFGVSKLLQNAETFLDSLKAQKPSSLKGIYVKTINLSTTQGPNIKIENSIIS